MLVSEPTDWRRSHVCPLALEDWRRSQLSVETRARLAVDALTECDSCLERACVPLDPRALDRFLVVHGVRPADVCTRQHVEDAA